MQEGEALDYDPTAYDCLHQFTLDWPCLRYAACFFNVTLLQSFHSTSIEDQCATLLMRSAHVHMQLQLTCVLRCSFDILSDDLGGPRSKFPHTMYIAAGTQAQYANQNHVALMRLSEINQGRHGSKARDDDADDMSDSDDEDAPPQIHTNRIAHHGGVNRLRCMPQQPAVVASWGDTGLVQVCLHPL